MRYSIQYYVLPVVTCPTPQFAVAEIVEIPSYIDDDAFSSPPFASGFGREDEDDGPSAPPPFDTDELPPPPPSFKSKLPTSGFRDPHPPSPKIRRPRRPYPTVGGAGGGSGHVAGGGGGNGGDLVTCFPPTCIPPSTATAVAALPLPSSSHHPLPPLHDEHNRDAYSGPRLDGPFLRFLDSNNSSFNRT